MIKRLLVAAAIALIANPSFVSAQDFFFSFDDASLQTTNTQTAGTSASAFLFADSTLFINSFNLEFTSSDANVLAITGGEVFNPTTLIGERFDIDPPFDPPFNVTSTGSAAIFPRSILGTGLNPNFNAFPDLVDPSIGAVVPGVGTLIARLDYDLVSGGEARLDVQEAPFDPDPLDLPVIDRIPLTFGSSLIVEATAVPEPSSAILLIFGVVGVAARRRRS